MLLQFTVTLPHIAPAQATQLLETFKQFNASLRIRKEGGYWLTVPSGRAPLRTSRLLKEFCTNRYPYEWRLKGVDDEGCPTIPISGKDSP